MMRQTHVRIPEGHRCLHIRVVKRGRFGRAKHYRNTIVTVPAQFLVPECKDCHAEVLDDETRVKLQKVLYQQYLVVLRQRARDAIDVLMEHISQRQLEALLGLSQGYLSRLRSGKGNPSAELVSNLALIAMDPQERIKELERYWATPVNSG